MASIAESRKVRTSAPKTVHHKSKAEKQSAAQERAKERARKKQEAQERAAALKESKKQLAEARRANKLREAQERKDKLQEKAVQAQLARDARIAGRSKLFPSTLWEKRFWIAVETLYPEIVWDNPSREAVYQTVVPLWRVFRWSPEEAATAMCRKCAELADPPQGAPVAGGGKFLQAKVQAKAEVRGAALRATHRPELPNLPTITVRAKMPPGQPRGRACPPDRGECGYTVQGGACTVSAPLRVPAKGGSSGTEKVPARYCLMEISQLITSNEPLRGFRENPQYPPGAQEREYGLKAEQAKVQKIADEFDPALIFNNAPGAIDGLPVASEGLVVLGGNGRAMGTRLVYAGKGGVPAETPRLYLIEHAAEFGLEPEIVERYAQPMLVRTIRVGDDPRVLAEWSRRLNTSLSQELDSTHLAVSRARFVSDAVLRELANSMAEDETLSAFLSSGRSRSFVRSLQTSDVITGRAAASYVHDGLLNDKGRDLVEDLLLALLIPDARLITAYGRGPVGVLARGAPYLVMASGEYDLREPLRLAVRDRITMRNQGQRTVAEYLKQGGLFATTGAAVAGDPRAKTLLHVLAALESSPVKFTKFARQFAAEVVTPADALRLAAEGAGVQVPP